MTREPGYLPRSSRASELTGPGPERPGSGSGAAALGSGSERRPPDPGSGSDSDSDSGGPSSSSQAGLTIPGTTGLALLDLIAMDEDAWDEFSPAVAIRRAHRAGFLRNVAVALGNWGAPEAVPALVRALDDPEPLVRAHAAWALARIGTGEACPALEVSAAGEKDPYVREEIVAAQQSLGSAGRVA